jgi:mannonate dehydratase
MTSKFMGSSRRNFIKKSASLTALSTLGLSDAHIRTLQNAKDANIELCLAYFYGLQERKIELSKQMGITGAVSPSSPGIAGLNNIKPWEYDGLLAVKETYAKRGLQWKVLEGTPPLDNAKLGVDGKDEQIDNFITLMKNMKRIGVDTICYNWMPVISWARTDFEKVGRGGALVTAFNYEKVKDLPLTEYGEVSEETMWKNIEYFLKAVVPEAEKNEIKLALHPDDPPVPKIRGIARIMRTANAFKKLIELYPSPSNGLTLCQGTFATMDEDIPSVIKYFGNRKKIFFVHFRDVRGDKWNFEETFHDDGKTDMYKAMKTYFEVGFNGPMREDHVPTVAGDSNEHPGYSEYGTLFAMGYIKGLIEAVKKG